VKEMKLETERLILREYTVEDFDDLYDILSDAETMKHYPKPFDGEKVRNWIQRSIDNYEIFGFGLWAVVLKESGKLIGDCGVTMQNINGRIKPEIGYHIHKDFQNKGYATEAARKCKDYIFENTPFNTIYSYMKYTNIGSYTVALKNGMKLVEEYDDPVNTVSKAYAITRGEWEIEKEHVKI
jgi:RimJ/RimL family protein N-acetyltransferase